MRISRRNMSIAAVVAVAAATLASTAAFASAGPDRRGDGSVLRFRTVLTSSAVNDAGHGGPGDVVALQFDVRTRTGDSVGQAHISCTVVTADVQLCHAGFVLARGQIEAQISVSMAATTFTAAVIGGTGAYEGATGQIVNVVTAPGVIDRTFHLIRPSRD
jgi:hypothetical protein